MNILVTGGAGFIGYHLVQLLAEMGANVCVVDNLLPQVHGEGPTFPEFPKNVDAILGDVRDRRLMERILRPGFDVVYHLAALTGVGQSMYEIENYVDVNCRGTATLLDAISGAPKRPKKIILSSSRAVYGEGRSRCVKCNLEFYPNARSERRLALQSWEHPCPQCGSDGAPLGSTETTSLRPASIYAITKMLQEQLWQTIGETHNIPCVIYRYFNVYGPRQSLSNPYTGILSIFARRLKNGQSIDVYEDGKETRDFVYISDVTQANLMACTQDVTGIFNVCSDEAISVYAIAQTLTDMFGLPSDTVEITGHYRLGDIRHGIGSCELARQAMGFQPVVGYREGLAKLVRSLPEKDLSDLANLDQIAQDELLSHGLFSERLVSGMA